MGLMNAMLMIPFCRTPDEGCLALAFLRADEAVNRMIANSIRTAKEKIRKFQRAR